MADTPDLTPAHADAFARGFPALADRLVQPGHDPELERLVEGFVELAQRVERVIDATSLRSVAHFAELLSPEILRPFPSATILELSPQSSRRPAREEIVAGAEFDSIAVEGTRCRFRANAPLTFVPWRVTDAKLAWSGASGHSLEVGLAPIETPRQGALGEGARPGGGAISTRVEDSPLPLRLHFTGEQRTALLLLSWIHEHLAGAELDVNGRATALGPDGVRPWGFRSDEALLPVEPHEHPGMRLLRELLILPAKFAFVDVRGPALGPIPAGARVVLRFYFRAAMPPSVRIDSEMIRTNCLPVINAFSTSADPIRPSLERPTQPVRPAAIRPEHGEVYAVRDVVARMVDGDRMPVAPVTAFGAGPPEARGMRYALERAPCRSGPGSDVSLAAAAQDQEDPAIDVLSIDLWATNRALPMSLGVGDVRLPAPLSPRGLAFRNLRALTPYRPASHGESLVWRAIALGAIARTLATRDALRTLLHALDLHAMADLQAGRSHAQKVEAIVDVVTAPAVERVGGKSVRGHDVAVRLSESAFDGEGEAFLFGEVLAHLFAHEASLNAFVRTSVQLVTTGRLFRFPVLNGEREVT